MSTPKSFQLRPDLGLQLAKEGNLVAHVFIGRTDQGEQELNFKYSQKGATQLLMEPGEYSAGFGEYICPLTPEQAAVEYKIARKLGRTGLIEH